MPDKYSDTDTVHTHTLIHTLYIHTFGVHGLATAPVLVTTPRAASKPATVSSSPLKMAGARLIMSMMASGGTRAPPAVSGAVSNCVSEYKPRLVFSRLQQQQMTQLVAVVVIV
jgi:hypothetical protein